MARRYSKEVHDFIAANVVGRTTKELVSIVNAQFGLDFTESAMKSYKTNHKLRSGTPVGLPKGHASKQFPEEVVAYITNNYHGCGPAEMAERLSKEFSRRYTVSQLKGFYSNHHINSGLTGYFPKGNVPFNKGRKGECAAGCEKTQFRKGNLPANTKPIGYERISKDGYVEVKIKMRPSRPDRNDNFVPKHRLIWEQAHGPIPDGYVVIFKDGDRQNFDLPNLALVSMAERLEMTRHDLFSKDASLTEAGIMVAKVRTTIHRKKRKSHKP